MDRWTPEQIALVLGAASAGIATVIGAISVAAVKVISALHGVTEKIQEQTDQLAEHDLRQEIRADRIVTASRQAEADKDCP